MKAALTGAVLSITMGPAYAQSGNDGSYAVVQPVPPQAAGDLNAALQLLARDSTNVDALVAAGDAALQLDDLDASLGFFQRAQSLAPNDGRVKAGLAGILLKKDRPVQALGYYKQAEAAGVAMDRYAADRGLAYDLVGQNAVAQSYYRKALATAPEPLVRRRLAMSLAISGDGEGAEAALLPLLQQQDLAAYRTRAFALAVLGRDDEAASIAETVLPERISSRLVPYLRYMVRLTPAQQAAAANLGAFPSAAEIGQDGPEVAQFAQAHPAPSSELPQFASAQPAGSSRNGDERLRPSGRPLGPRTSQEVTKNSAETGRKSAKSAAKPGRTPLPEKAPVTGELPPVDGSSTDRVDVAKSADPAASDLPPGFVVNTPAASSSTARKDAERATPALSRTDMTPAPAPTDGSSLQNPVPEKSAPEKPVHRSVAAPSVLARTDPDAGAVEPLPLPGEDPAPSVPAAINKPAAASPSLDQAFADFRLSSDSEPTPAAGAVDITSIEPPRERPEPPKPPKPQYPSRHWVQVATGKNISAFAYDWKRIQRKAGGLLDGKEAFMTPWVEANRLLTGPFASSDEAQDMVTKLKKAGVDSFSFTSAEGEKITAIK
ncbi:tetratricopeptide repeat protein [Altericroceibacterium endophyticum]|uniref:SPOR domain-containing protein n=1 Tax=Altericroceibacterium endophyticum TaxID=1808508 RepID=A0A6I4T7L5_9SPHN|nr:tetratricopeptide repeat protein [Altericroceibacterium endophyticum]MXO66449.1 hypothetical protein [Altericroceibacterium endophyticum]